jgi:pimeloyl-ACP methyl ester carboxylesterase
MASPPTVSATGLSTQRQLDALYSGPKLFAAGSSLKATLSTGLTVSYSLHTSGPASSDGGSVDEERLVLIMGFLQPKESWASVITYLLEKWAQEGKRLSILVFDNRGIGGSDAPFWRYTTSQMAEDALALMDHLDWDSAHVAGIRYGCLWRRL